MARKIHLANSYNNVSCQGRTGMSLRGEYITVKFEDFRDVVTDTQCAKCASSNFFTYMLRQEQKELDKWEPVDNPEDWKAHDDALIVVHKAKR